MRRMTYFRKEIKTVPWCLRLSHVLVKLGLTGTVINLYKNLTA
jgi:hypothetical protein